MGSKLLPKARCLHTTPVKVLSGVRHSRLYLLSKPCLGLADIVLRCTCKVAWIEASRAAFVKTAVQHSLTLGAHTRVHCRRLAGSSFSTLSRTPVFRPPSGICSKLVASGTEHLIPTLPFLCEPQYCLRPYDASFTARQATQSQTI